MSRKRIKQVIAIVVLVALLLLLGALYLNYRQTKHVGIRIDFNSADLLPAPQYLYSFSGDGSERLVRPIGILVDGDRVLVADSVRGTIDVFSPQGKRIAVWGKGKVVVPLYIAKNPKTGEYWVSDRRLRAVVIFDSKGNFKGTFDPKLPKDQLPKFDTKGVQWTPLALAFAPDGTLYVTETLNGHRMLIFGPDGKFRRSVGTAGDVTKDPKNNPNVFYFPNSVKVKGDEVWVADSNNLRIQVFDRKGDFKRIIVTMGLPRGMDFLPKKNDREPQRFVVVDTLGHDFTIWDASTGKSAPPLGSQGVEGGKFEFPIDISIDSKRRIFITDQDNSRVQVWGWPEEANPVPLPTTPGGWAACLSPLLILPLLPFLRRRRYFATADFVEAMFEAGQLDRMVQRRVRWEITPDDYEAVRALSAGSVRAEDLLNPVEHSESDAAALMDRYELEMPAAIRMSIARRAKLFCTENPELRRVARVLEVPVVDHIEYIARTTRRGAGGRGDGTPIADFPASGDSGDGTED